MSAASLIQFWRASKTAAVLAMWLRLAGLAVWFWFYLIAKAMFLYVMFTAFSLVARGQRIA